MNFPEIFLGFIIYVLIMYLWHSPIFFGGITNQKIYLVEKNKNIYFRSIFDLWGIIISGLLTVFCFYKLVTYSAISPYKALFLLWGGFLLPVLIYFYSLKKINKTEFFIYGGGFLMSLIGLATAYSIW